MEKIKNKLIHKMINNYIEKGGIQKMNKFFKKGSLKYLLGMVTGITIGLTTVFGTTSFATSKVDVTPPWGRLKITGATTVNNINYVERTEIEVQIYAKDDICAETDIKFYVSMEEISDTEALADNLWESYTPGITKTLTLPNTTSTNTVYAIFKDATGNTSLIYNGTETAYTIVYDANGGTETPTGVGTAGYFGMPFTVTTQTPKKEGYYFWGWSTNPNATTPSYRQGDIIPANVFMGTNKTITLYAVWTTDTSGLPLLSETVSIGDYVNYPVYYDNISNTSYNGWRVISKDIDLDGNQSIGTVNLISAGIPLSYYHSSNSSTSETALITNFLTTKYDPSAGFSYRKTGFSPYSTLTETFTNKYTEMNGTAPKVRSMVKEDILRVTGDETFSNTISLTKAEYQNLFHVGQYYWLASAYNTDRLWYVYSNGNIGSDNIELGVRPVVSLKSTVKTTGTDMIGAWNIEV